jgi:membrane protein implicated in regulation of membrane protease activity
VLCRILNHLLPSSPSTRVLQMLLAPGGWLNLATWAVAAAANFGLLPFIPRISWSSGLGGTVLLATGLNFGCRWWGVAAFAAPADPLPRVSWWWWLLLAVLYGFTALMQAAEQLRREEEEAKHGGRAGSSGFGRGHAGERGVVLIICAAVETARVSGFVFVQVAVDTRQLLCVVCVHRADAGG